MMSNDHSPAIWSVAALADVSEVVEQLQESLIKMENFQKLLELKKDLIGADNLVVPGRVSSKLETILILYLTPKDLHNEYFSTACVRK